DCGAGGGSRPSRPHRRRARSAGAVQPASGGDAVRQQPLDLAQPHRVRRPYRAGAETPLRAAVAATGGTVKSQSPKRLSNLLRKVSCLEALARATNSNSSQKFAASTSRTGSVVLLRQWLEALGL